MVKQPRSITTDGVKFLFVTDRHRNTIHVFNYDGEYIRDLSHGLLTNVISMVYYKQGIFLKYFCSSDTFVFMKIILISETLQG